MVQLVTPWINIAFAIFYSLNLRRLYKSNCWTKQKCQAWSPSPWFRLQDMRDHQVALVDQLRTGVLGVAEDHLASRKWNDGWYENNMLFLPRSTFSTWSFRGNFLVRQTSRLFLLYKCFAFPDNAIMFVWTRCAASTTTPWRSGTCSPWRGRCRSRSRRKVYR